MNIGNDGNLDFDITENCLFDDSSKLKFTDIKSYVNLLKNSYFDTKEEKYLKVIKILSGDQRKNVIKLSESLSKFIYKMDQEINRVKSMYEFDRKFSKCIFIAGTDEVGRGPLAGPIVAASVILNLNYKSDKDLILGIKDSKKLSASVREKLSKVIKSKALDFNIALINNTKIDERGISWCNNEVLRKAADGLKIQPDLVLSDGYAVKNLNIDNEFIIKGDAKSASIACASIIAKVYRDNLMREYSKEYPNYRFENNSGYGTKEHIEAIRKYGVCKIHRRYFLKNII
ncbi:ribonuclease HII [Clostridium fermenticellae]|uniref:Ribonuclease HII n=1 Tax=Clostridium fermenticellae TaxID=2068654 RepID=A0A386H2W3_9CLOT|nr:ribonuclease HII [Clostridium fermenticellae]AYD40051.1 ribonuclease HII [Clostridium fermenticellae]